MPIVEDRQTAKKEKYRVCLCSSSPRMYPMENIDVRIQRPEATMAKNTPAASAFKANWIFGVISKRRTVATRFSRAPGRSVKTSTNLTTPAANVQNSLRLGFFRLTIINGTAARETSTAYSGTAEVYRSDIFI